MKTNRFILLSCAFMLILFAFFSMGAQPARHVKPVYGISYESIQAPTQAKKAKENAKENTKKAPNCCDDNGCEDC